MAVGDDLLLRRHGFPALSRFESRIVLARGERRRRAPSIPDDEGRTSRDPLHF
jgi:hypothetical protein